MSELENQVGRRNLLRGGAGAGLALSAMAVIGARGAAAQSGDAHEAQAEHDEAAAAIEEHKNLLERAETEITDDTRAVYDRMKSVVTEAEEKFESAASLPAKEAKRAYREIQHLFHDLDHDIDSALHWVEHAPESVWHEIRDSVRKVHNAIDHVLDAINPF